MTEIQNRLRELIKTTLNLEVDDKSMAILRVNIERTVLELSVKAPDDYEILLIVDDNLPGKLDVRITGARK